MTDAVAEPKRKRTIKRRTGADALIAAALVEQGLSLRSVSRATGIPPSTVQNIVQRKVLAPEHVEHVKRSLKDRFAVLADRCLNAVDDNRLAKASLGELVKAAATASQQAGVTNSNHEHFHSVMHKYEVCISQPPTTHSQVEAQAIDVQANQPSITSDTLSVSSGKIAGSVEPSTNESST